MCRHTQPLEDYYYGVKYTLSSINKLCKTNKECDDFRDDLFVGAQSRQVVAMDDKTLKKVDAYYITHLKSNTSLFSTENLYAVFGLGRSDLDGKYTSATVEEISKYSSIDSKTVMIHFVESGFVSVGDRVDWRETPSQLANTFDVLNTFRLSIAVQKAQFERNGSITHEIPSVDTEFEISCNQRKSSLPAALFNETLEFIEQSISLLGLNHLVSNRTNGSLIIEYDGDIKDINKLLSVTLLTPQKQRLIFQNLFIPHPELNDFAKEGKEALRFYDLAFEAGNQAILGNSYLNGRVMQLESDGFHVSILPMSQKDLQGLDRVVVSQSSRFMFVLFMIVFSFLVLYKACEGCATSILPDK